MSSATGGGHGPPPTGSKGPRAAWRDECIEEPRAPSDSGDLFPLPHLPTLPRRECTSRKSCQVRDREAVITREANNAIDSLNWLALTSPS